MEQNKEISTLVQTQVLHKNLSIEFGTELSLPDYRSEISRLLWIKPTVLPPAHFVGGGNADFSGRVCYHVLYAGPDGELHVAQTEDSYGFSLPLAANEAPIFSVRVVPEAVIGRVVAPRKLTVRCRAGAQVRAYADTYLCRSLSDDVLRKGCTVSARAEHGRILCATGDAVEVEDELTAPEVSEVLHARAEVFLPDVSVGEGIVRCRGDAVVSLLCLVGEERTPTVMTKRVPCLFEIPTPDVDGSYRASAFAMATDTRAVAQDGRIVLCVSMVPFVEAVKNEEITYVKDLFLEGQKTNCKMGTKRLWQSATCANRNVSISESLPLATARLLEGDVIIDAYAEAELKGDGTGGELCCHVLYSREGEFGVCEVSLPFRAPLDDVDATPLVMAHVPILRARVDGDKLRVDAELALCVRGERESTVTLLEEVEVLGQEQMPRLDVEICYPAPADTLWELGKRYAVSPDRIAAANGLAGCDVSLASSLQGVRCLLIPPITLQK